MNKFRMDAVDAAWLHMDRPVNELVVNAVLWFDEPVDDELVREAIEKRLVGQHARFAQRVSDSGTAAWWVDVPDFDPMTQVTRERMDPPADLSVLTSVVSRLASTPLPRDRPLWQVHVVDGYLGGTALIARIHHCIADGVALFRVLLSLSDEAQDGGLAAPMLPSPVSHQTAARKIGTAVVTTTKVIRSALGLVTLPPDRRTSLRTAPGMSKSIRWTEPLPLVPIKARARATGSTVNDVVLAAVSGALGRRLGASAQDVRAVLPVNLRPLDTVEIELGNRFGLVFLKLPVTTASSDERIAIVHRRTTALKRSATAPVALAILGLVGHAHRRIVGLVIDVFSSKASLVVTNVPGPQHSLHLGGHRLSGVIAWPPQSGSLGVGISLISYDGHVIVGLMSDDHVVPDPDALLAALYAELTEPERA